MSTFQSSLPGARVAVSIGIVGLLYFSLPIQLPTDDDELSSEGCLSLADRPPAGGPEALTQLEQCSTAVPDDVELIADLGDAYEAAGRSAEAEAAYRRAVTLDPEHADVRVRLARLLLGRGDKREAGEHAAAALRVQPNRQAIRELIPQTTVSP